jgi:hypothetical protein
MCGCKGKCGCNIISTTKGEKGDASPVASLGYKVYTALISQSGTSAPTVTVLQNTLGTIVWTYASVGSYVGTLSGAFINFNKNWVYLQPASDNAGAVDVLYIDNTDVTGSTVILNTYSDTTAGTPSNNIIEGKCLEIRVYP